MFEDRRITPGYIPEDMILHPQAFRCDRGREGGQGIEQSYEALLTDARYWMADAGGRAYLH